MPWVLFALCGAMIGRYLASPSPAATRQPVGEQICDRLQPYGLCRGDIGGWLEARMPPQDGRAWNLGWALVVASAPTRGPEPGPAG